MYKSRYQSSSKIAKRQRARRLAGVYLKFALLALILAAGIFTLRADFMQVKIFEVAGTETLNPESLKSDAQKFISGSKYLLIPKSNILFLNKDKLASALLSDFGRIKELQINKKYLDRKVLLAVSERRTEYLWCSQECYFMTNDGFIFEKAGSGSEGKVIFRGGVEGKPLNQNFASPEKMQNYSKFIITLSKAAIRVESIEMESSDKASAMTNIGQIIFSPDEADLQVVAENVILLLSDLKKEKPALNFEYLDARFGNKIFYKIR